MRLALPVSHQIHAENFQDFSNCEALEYREPGKLLSSNMECLFHSGKGIIEHDFIDYFSSIRGFLADNEVKLFSFDLGPAAEVVGKKDYYYIPESEVLSANQLKLLISERLQTIRQCFAGEIAFENLNQYPSDAYETVCDPSFITEVVEESETGFLLDIAHAVISANNRGEEIDDYLDALPLDKVVEVHLSGSGYCEKRKVYYDFHDLPDESDFCLLRDLIRKIPENSYLALEYYRDYDKIKYCYDSLSVFSVIPTQF